ncbi:MAG: nitrate reductase gamma subunit [Firmicutes bacterium]|nr:nitrate reductase gamma subunit [Bacillota bacterium]
MFLTLFAYFSILAFIGLTLLKVYQFAKMPMHGRWELYPVPKEGGGRGHYGGSYYEEKEWWNKPRNVSHAGEVIDMLKEMLFIKNLFVNQRRQWWICYALHLGIYVLFVWTFMLFVGAGTELAGISVAAATGGWGSLVYYATFLAGVVGAILLAVGAAGMFLKRLSDDKLKKYTTPQEYFNLLFLFAVAASGLVVWSGDIGFNYGREIIIGMLTLSPIQADAALTIHIILLGAVMIYIPQTKMSHYVGKYFAFHKVLWENEPNLKNSEMEEVVKGALGYQPKTGVKWSAPHINPTATSDK